MLTVSNGLPDGWIHRSCRPDPACHLRAACRTSQRRRRAREGPAGLPARGLAAPEGAQGRGTRRGPSGWHAADLPAGPGRGGRAARLPRHVLEPRAHGFQAGRRAGHRGEEMTVQAPTNSVRKSVVVNAPVERAFHVFTAEMHSWWPPDHHLIDAPLDRMVFEARTGGRIYDVGTDGSECQWARVLAYEPPTRVVFSWDIN